MRSPFSVAAGLVLGLAIGMFARTPDATSRNASRNTSQMVDAAFRDGTYLAKLDAQNGRKPRLMSGRWNSNADRAMFIVGYEQTYQEAAGAGQGKSPKADAAEVAGYLDGMADGAADGASSHVFRSERTSNYLNARQESAPAGADAAKFREDYRVAYANGYQQGYYANQSASLWSYYSL
jgi:hypothetical protein